MRLRAAAVLCSFGPLLLPRLAAAAPVWVGDFETNDLSQWSGTLNEEIDGVDYITVVDDVVAQGSYAARIELHNDAVWPNGLKRVELHHSPTRGRTDEGATTFFAWSFYLPEALPVDPEQSMGYWETDSSYQQLMVWQIAGERITFATRYPEYTEQWQQDGAATAATWHRIATRVLWSQDPTIGEVDVWFDGEQVVTAAAVATLVDENSAFTQLGLLRGAFEFDDVPVIYIDDAIEGDSLEDVHPDLEPAGTDSGSSSDGGPATTTGSDGADTTGNDDTTAGNDDATATVTDSGPSTSPTTTDDGSSGTSGAPGEDDESSGCSCTSTGARNRDNALFPLAGLLLVLVRARRRLSVTSAGTTARPGHPWGRRTVGGR